MRSFYLTLSFFCLCEVLSAQVKWILEPTQDSYEFVTPGIDLFDFIIVKYWDGTTKVVDPKGNTIFDRDIYGWPFFSPSQKNISFRLKNGNVRYYNTKYELINKGYEDTKSNYGYNTLTTTKNGLLGLMDLEGNVLIENKYKLLKRIRNGKFKAITVDGDDIILSINDISSYPEQDASCILNETTIYKVADEAISFVGILDSRGDTLLKHEKYYVSRLSKCTYVLSDSLLIVKSIETNKYGLLNLEGELVIECKYNSFRNVNDSCFLANVYGDNDLKKVLDLRTKSISSFGYDKANVSGGKIVVQNGKFTGYLDLKGEILIAPIYHSIIDSDDKTIFKRNDSIFIYSKMLKAFAQDTFTLSNFSLGTFNVVGKGDKLCIYDCVNLKPVTKMKYSKINNFNGLYECLSYTNDTTYYDPPKQYTNKHGEVVKYSTTTRKKYSYEYRDSMGTLKYGPTNSKLEYLNKTYSRQSITKDSVAFVNTTTFEVQKFLKKYADSHKIFGYSSGSIIRSKDKYFVFDHFLDSEIDAIPYDFLKFNKKTGVYIYRQERKFGFLDTNRILTKPEFDGIELRGGNQYVVELDEKYGILMIDSRE
jgi:hypothetical protein